MAARGHVGLIYKGVVTLIDGERIIYIEMERKTANDSERPIEYEKRRNQRDVETIWKVSSIIDILES